MHYIFSEGILMRIGRFGEPLGTGFMLHCKKPIRISRDSRMIDYASKNIEFL
jgi:hypothetical protein